MLAAGTAAARDLADDRRWWRAARLVDEGRCPTALPLLDELLEEQPASAELLRARGRCELRMQRYPAAAASLEAAQAADPSLRGVALPLAVARFHAGDVAGAETALQLAEAEEPDRPEVQLYRGLILLQGGQSGAATAYLARARSADSAAVDPVASYYEAQALAANLDQDDAEAALRRVIEEHPDTPWAERAEEALAALEDARLRTWAFASFGYEYDDNVVLRAPGVVLPDEISGQRDSRLVWSAGGGLERQLRPGLRVGALAAYEGTAQRELDDFDYDYPTFTGWLDQTVARATVVRAQADLAYAWVGGKPYLGYQRYGGSILRGWDAWGTTQAGAHWASYDYFFGTDDVPDGPGMPGAPCFDPDTPLCAPPGIDEERARRIDGDETGASLDHTLPLGLGDWSLQAGYRYRHYDAPNSEYAHDAHQVIAQLRGTLPLGLRLRLAGSFSYRPYRTPSTFPDPNGLVFNRQYALSRDDRLDEDWTVEVGLERDLGRYATLAARWTWRNNDSNVQVFDYRRNILGVYLTVGAGD